MSESMFVLWQHWSERVEKLLGVEWEMPSENMRGTAQMLLALGLFKEGKTPEQATVLMKLVE